MCASTIEQLRDIVDLQNKVHTSSVPSSTVLPFDTLCVQLSSNDFKDAKIALLSERTIGEGVNTVIPSLSLLREADGTAYVPKSVDDILSFIRGDKTRNPQINTGAEKLALGFRVRGYRPISQFLDQARIFNMHELPYIPKFRSHVFTSREDLLETELLIALREAASTLRFLSINNLNESYRLANREWLELQSRLENKYKGAGAPRAMCKFFSENYQVSAACYRRDQHSSWRLEFSTDENEDRQLLLFCRSG